MTTEQKFNAAVNVIRSLPKNGSYQPSNDLMLRFYAYYKQATQGPNQNRRPPFYDLVARAKHDAWNNLLDMPRKQAMARYVEELHSIVETMSYSDKVANFLEAPSSEIDCVNKIMDDLELVAGDVLERVRSQPNSPLTSREASPVRTATSSGEVSPQAEESDHSDDEFIDTIEFPDTRKYPYAEQNGHVSRSRTKSHVDISQEVSKAVNSLKMDVERLADKINMLEKLSGRRKSAFGEMPLPFITFVLIWPFVAVLIMNKYVYKRK